jgi:uncharacterized protein YndB with AHSA1/START domain
MSQDIIVERTLLIKAPVEKVWKALTDPEQIKQYLFGTTTETTWQKGSPITYKGEWQGKSYEDKGTIIDIIPGKLLHTTYFSSMSGKEDLPENYAHVVYKLEPKGNETLVLLTQDNVHSEEERKHLEQNWDMVLKGMKKLVEK